MVMVKILSMVMAIYGDANIDGNGNRLIVMVMVIGMVMVLKFAMVMVRWQYRW